MSLAEVGLLFAYAVGCADVPNGEGECVSERDCHPLFMCVDSMCVTRGSSCTNEQLDGTETDIDCGAGCGGCLAGQRCTTSMDCLTANCQAGVCGTLSSCDDRLPNGGETDIDCGGTCAPCNLGGACRVNEDCVTGRCEGGACVALPSCDDGQLNGVEVDVDCGGSCEVCDVGQRCAVAEDCITVNCLQGLCVALPTCDDDQQNGGETDIDCGGTCTRCDVGQRCTVDNDCSGECSAGLCVPTPTCTDNLQNGNETDVDCGGVCPSCRIGQGCGDHDDCETSNCSVGTCTALRSCNDLHQYQPAASSGRYLIDPDGSGSGEPIRVYCNMTFSGGGWTLVMRLDGGAELSYDALHWTTESLLRPGELSPTENFQSAVNAKFEAFDRVQGTELALEWIEPSNNLFIYDRLANRTALELFRGNQDRVAGSGSARCIGDTLSSASGYDASRMRHGRSAQFFGINGRSASDGISTWMRFGFGSNDETGTLWYPHHGIGIGGATELSNGAPSPTSILWQSHSDCDDCGCYGQPESFPAAAANLWVR